MATTAYPVNHALAVKLWSKKVFHDVIGEEFFKTFVGEGSDSLIQMKTETSKGPGDRIRVPLRQLLTGDGVQGDATLEGNEEALATYYDDVLINQLRHAVRSDGKMSEQRVPFSVREEARMGLKDWWSERLQVTMANQLTGNTGQSDTKYTGNNSTIAPTATTRIICGGGKTLEASLSSSTDHAIALTDLDRAVTLAKVAANGAQRIRPVKVDGKKYYVVFLHPYQILRLRANAAASGDFVDIHKAQLQGGKISDNPLMTRASFVYGECLVHEWSYLPVLPTNPTTTGATVTNFRRGVLCGAQSLLLGIGQDGGAPSSMSWKEELFDYGNQLGVKAGMIFGVKKTVFNSVDFGTVVLSGYAPAP